jgi:hypothetical protein
VGHYAAVHQPGGGGGAAVVASAAGGATAAHQRDCRTHHAHTLRTQPPPQQPRLQSCHLQQIHKAASPQHARTDTNKHTSRPPPFHTCRPSALAPHLHLLSSSLLAAASARRATAASRPPLLLLPAAQPPARSARRLMPPASASWLRQSGEGISRASSCRACARRRWVWWAVVTMEVGGSCWWTLLHDDVVGGAGDQHHNWRNRRWLTCTRALPASGAVSSWLLATRPRQQATRVGTAPSLVATADTQAAAGSSRQQQQQQQAAAAAAAGVSGHSTHQCFHVVSWVTADEQMCPKMVGSVLLPGADHTC